MSMFEKQWFIWPSWERCLNAALAPPIIRPGRGHATPASQKPRPQAVGEDHAHQDGAEREAAAHAADLLQRQPAARRAHEGAAGGDDRPEPAGDPRLVPEQALQRQEEVHPHEAAAVSVTQRQNRELAFRVSYFYDVEMYKWKKKYCVILLVSHSQAFKVSWATHAYY